MGVLIFVAGLFVGSLIGVFAMAIVAASRDD